MCCGGRWAPHQHRRQEVGKKVIVVVGLHGLGPEVRELKPRDNEPLLTQPLRSREGIGLGVRVGLGAGARVVSGGGSSGDGFLGSRGMTASNGESATALGTVLADKARLRSMDLRSLDRLPLFSGPTREARRSSIASRVSSAGTGSEGEARSSIDLRSIDLRSLYLLPLFSGPVREASRASIASIDVPPSSLHTSGGASAASNCIPVGLVAQSSIGWIARPSGCTRSTGAPVKASDVDAIAAAGVIAAAAARSRAIAVGAPASVRQGEFRGQLC